MIPYVSRISWWIRINRMLAPTHLIKHNSDIRKKEKEKHERMWRTRVTFFPRCKQLCVIFVDRPYIWVTGRVCTRSNKKTHSMHAYVMKAHARWRLCGMLLTRYSGGFIFERGPSFWHVRVNGFGIACYAFVHARGANEGFMEITQPIISLNG